MARLDEVYRIYTVIHCYPEEEGRLVTIPDLQKHIHLTKEEISKIVNWMIENNFVEDVNINALIGMIPAQFAYRIPEKYIKYDQLYKIYREIDVPESALIIEIDLLFDN
jgi:hypothetical protein